MPNHQNGQLILLALKQIEPATMTEIVAYVADTSGLKRTDIKDSVASILEGGIHHGYIQRQNRRYFAAPIDLDGTVSADEDSDPEPEKKGPDVEDRSRRRRRGGRRSRSGSRRRRSRRRRSRR